MACTESTEERAISCTEELLPKGAVVQDDIPRTWAEEAVDQVRLAVPMCMGFSVRNLVASLSMVLVGHLPGPRDETTLEFAAVSLAVSLANVSGYSFIIGVAGTLQTTSGQAFGRRDFGEVCLDLQRCTLICMLMMCPIAGVWCCADPLLVAMGQDPGVAQLAQRYLVLLLPGMFCFVVTQCLQNWLAAQRETGPAGTGGLLNAAIFCPLAWYLVYPAGLGYQGLAIATTLSNVALMFYTLGQAKKFLRGRLSQSWTGFSRGAFTGWIPFLRLAVPNLVMVSEWWAAEIALLMAGELRRPGLSLAEMSLATNNNSVCYVLPLSLATVVNTRVSNELGAGNPRRAQQATRVSLHLGTIVVCVQCWLVVTFRREWARVFISDPDVVEGSSTLLALCGVYGIADGMASVLAGSLKGCARHTMCAFVVVFSYYAMGLPSCWLFGMWDGLGTFGLVLGTTIGSWSHLLLYVCLLGATSFEGSALRAKLSRTN